MTDEEIERLTVLFLQVRPLDPAPHPGEIKTRAQGAASWPVSTTSTAIPSLA
jgi:hypothetical protein